MPTKTLKEIVLRDFVAIALGPVVDRISIPAYIAQQIELEDKEESIAHIEWPEDSSQSPLLWRAEDWRTSSKLAEHKKKLSTLDRAIWVKSSELRNALARKIQIAVSLTPEESQRMVDTIIAKRNEAAAQYFGTNLAELLLADQELQSYKNTTQKKWNKLLNKSYRSPNI